MPTERTSRMTILAWLKSLFVGVIKPPAPIGTGRPPKTTEPPPPIEK